MSMNSSFQIFSASFRGTGREVLPITTALTELVGTGGEISWLKGVPGINSPLAPVLLPASGPLAVVCVILRGFAVVGFALCWSTMLLGA